MTIQEIENLTEVQTAGMAEEKLSIKGHDIYLVDLQGRFGYSCLVFRGAHIYYANDYQLHHSGKSREELRELYIKALNLKLFTDAEIGDDLTDYTEFTRKENFLRNYWGMQKPHKSIFRIDDGKPKQRNEIPFSHYDPVCFAYYQDKDFVKRHKQLLVDLYMAQDRKREDPDYWRKAFVYEMANHEYGINWEADYDTFSAFGNPQWRGESENTLEKWFDDLGFNKVQRTAYREAVAEYYRRYE